MYFISLVIEARVMSTYYHRSLYVSNLLSSQRKFLSRYDWKFKDYAPGNQTTGIKCGPKRYKEPYKKLKKMDST